MAGDKRSENARRRAALLAGAADLLRIDPRQQPTVETAEVQRLVAELGQWREELERQNASLLETREQLSRARDRCLSELSDSKGALSQLQRNEQRYRRLTEALTDYVYRVRIDHGRVTETIHGAGCESVTGYSEEEFQEDSSLWLSLIPPEDRSLVQEQVARVLAGESVVSVEHRIRCKDGSIRWVANTASAQHIDSDLIAYDGLLRDITPRKEAEAALQRMNEELESQVAEQTQAIRLQAQAIASLGEGVVITDDELAWPGPKILFVNDAMCRITGYDAEELVGQTPRILQRGQSDREMLEAIWTRLAANEPVSCEMRNFRKDGSSYDADVFITPLFDEEGRRTHLVAVHRDVTELKQLQKEILEIAADEDRRIGQELHDQVQQALTGLALLAETQADTLRDKSLSEAQAAARLARGIEDAAACVQQLARGLIPVEVDAEGLRAALEDLAATTTENAGLDCQFFSTGTVDVNDNFIATHLYRIAQEAVTNAIKHSRSDRVSVALTGEGDAITLQILDNGIGIGEKKGQVDRGMGFRIMRYRATLIGATIFIGARRESGTEVRCTIFRRGMRYDGRAL